MPSPKHLNLRLALLLSCLIVGGCASRVKIQVISPPALDIEAAIEPKPVPTTDIVTSAKAAADFDASIEAWGDRVSAAGARICRWTVDAGGKLPFKCPKP